MLLEEGKEFLTSNSLKLDVRELVDLLYMDSPDALSRNEPPELGPRQLELFWSDLKKKFPDVNGKGFGPLPL